MGHIAHLWKKYLRVAGLLKIIIILSWKRAWSFIWKWNFNPQHLTSLVEICPVVLGKKSFKICQCIFTLLQLSPIWRECGPSFEKKMNPNHLRKFCAKFDWNWPNDSKDFQIFMKYFCYYLPLEKRVVLHMNKLQSPFSNWWMLCAKVDWNWPSDSGEENKNDKSLILWWRRTIGKF